MSITTILNENELGREVATLARKNGEQMLNMSRQHKRKFVREAFKVHRVVWTIWVECDRVGVFCAKGKDVLDSGPVLTTAIPVEDWDTAIALATELGDGAPHLAHEMPRGVV